MGQFRSWRSLLAGVLALIAGPASGIDVHADTAAGTERLSASLASARFIAYTPRSFAVRAGAVTRPDAAAIRRDLQLLRSHFDALVTYSAFNGHEQIADIAQALGYRAMMLGVWNPGDPQELAAAIATARAHPALVVAVLVGNEGILVGRYPLATLLAGMARIRAALPGVAVTTVEPYATYLRDDLPGFLDAQDFLCPNIHPVYEPWFESGKTDAELVNFVLDIARQLRSRRDRPLVLHETGMPSGPAGGPFSETRQRSFWSLMQARSGTRPIDALVWFEAFDAEWKPHEAERDFGGRHPEEAYWGFFTKTGRAKAVLSLPALAPLAPAPDTP